MYTYLWINILTIIFPLIFSFEPNMKFFKKWAQIWPALIIVAAIFIVWDHYFTLWGIWAFNPKFVMGWFIYGLPVEEWMFFITIPYACMFVYETVRYYDWFKIPNNISIPILFVTMAILAVLAFVFRELLYTSVTFGFASLSLGLFWLVFKNKYLSLFLITYAIQLLPFLIVNGILTSWPVLIYNNSENLSLRIGTIPVEDAIYSLIILTLNIIIYELLSRWSVPKSDVSHA